MIDTGKRAGAVTEYETTAFFTHVRGLTPGFVSVPTGTAAFECGRPPASVCPFVNDFNALPSGGRGGGAYDFSGEQNKLAVQVKSCEAVLGSAPWWKFYYMPLEVCTGPTLAKRVETAGGTLSEAEAKRHLFALLYADYQGLKYAKAQGKEGFHHNDLHSSNVFSSNFGANTKGVCYQYSGVKRCWAKGDAAGIVPKIADYGRIDWRSDNLNELKGTWCQMRNWANEAKECQAGSIPVSVAATSEKVFYTYWAAGGHTHQELMTHAFFNDLISGDTPADYRIFTDAAALVDDAITAIYT